MLTEISTIPTQPRLQRTLNAFAIAGIAASLLGLVLAPRHTFPSLLLASFYVLGLSLGGLVLVALHYVTKAGWSTVLRRIPEALADMLPAASFLLALSLLGYNVLYPWKYSHDGHSVHGLWWSPAFFLVRAVVCMAIWIAFAAAILRNSRKQDRTGALALTHTNLRLSAAFLVVFGITFSLASFDWLMSLQPHWFSTIFAIYNFSGLFTSAIAAVTLIVILLKWSGVLRNVVTPDHLHDLGKYLFAFCTFWGYIWFCQYMLIWYANVAEEVPYYNLRHSRGWMPLSMLVVILNWAAPFFILLSTRNKKNETTLAQICVVVLAGRWLDLFVMMLPPFLGEWPTFSLWLIAPTIGLLIAFVLLFLRTINQSRLIPAKDPMLVESLPQPTHH